jgi:hypothetical protein
MAGAVTLPTPADLSALRRRYETELFESVVPFWTRHSPDRVNGGYYNCLPGDAGMVKGLCYGALVWFFRVVMSCASQALMLRIPAATTLYMLLSGLVEMLVLGLGYGLALWPAT